jgi:putative heme iron utilization protein
MASADAEQQRDEGGAPAREARQLLRAANSGTLATAVDGQPFAALVTPAPAPDLGMLLLLSELSPHTRHLRAEPRCALMVRGAPADTNPQTAPRVTVTGLAMPVDDAALRARWLARHPYAGFYAGFGDFHLWRIQIGGAHYVGGFARAFRLHLADLLPDPAAVEAVAAAEAAIIAHWNADHAEGLARVARSAGGVGGSWQMVAVDTDGCDLACGDTVLRVAWSAPADSAAAVRCELARLAGSD